MNRRSRYAKKVRERAVRLVLTGEHDHSSRWAAIQSVASKIGKDRRRYEKIDVDTGVQPGITTDQSQRMKELQREARELKPSNDILRKAAAFFAHADLDRKPKRWQTLSISIMMFEVSSQSAKNRRLHHLRIIIIKYVRSIHRGAVHE